MDHRRQDKPKSLYFKRMWGRQAHPPRGFELVQAEKRPFWLSLITLFGVFSDVDFKGFNPLSWRLWGSGGRGETHL